MSVWATRNLTMSFPTQVDEALEAAGLPPTLAVITTPHPAGLRGELETWLAAVTKRDPSEPMVAPLRVDGLVVLKADAAAGAATAAALAAASRASSADLSEPDVVEVAEPLAEPEPDEFSIDLGVELPPGCVVGVDPAQGLRKSDTGRALSVLLTPLGHDGDETAEGQVRPCSPIRAFRHA